MIFIGIALFLALSCSAWYFAVTEWKAYTMNLTRQHLFELRDRLFDAARRGDISYDSTAYGMARVTINGMIRFCHELTFGRMLTIAIAAKFAGTPKFVLDYQQNLDTALAELPLDQQKLVKATMHEMNVFVVMHLLRTSTLFIYLMIGTVIATTTRRITRSVLKKATRSVTVQIIEGQANFLGAAA